MPNRILKESICTSENVEGLSWFEEVCFYRLIVQCDDYGRADARIKLLRARLFPLREDVTAEMLEGALAALEQARLIERYTVLEQPYLRLVTWENHQRIRVRRSRLPPPPWEADDAVTAEAGYKPRSIVEHVGKSGNLFTMNEL